MLEETGLAVALGRLMGVSSDVSTNRRNGHQTHTVRLVYEASIVEGDLRAELAGTTDLAAWHPVDLAGLPVMAFVGEVLATR